MDDFRKYATKHLGMNSLVLDDVIKSQAGVFKSLYPGRTSTECNPVGCILPPDDGSYYFSRYADR